MPADTVPASFLWDSQEIKAFRATHKSAKLDFISKLEDDFPGISDIYRKVDFYLTSPCQNTNKNLFLRTAHTCMWRKQEGCEDHDL